MKKNLLSGLLAGVMAVSLVACGNSESTPAADSTTETAKPATAENSDTFDVEMVGNSFSIEYCNINVDGARDAVDDLAKKGVTKNQEAPSVFEFHLAAGKTSFLPVT